MEKYLEKCLDSLTGQTLADIEIIAVDDGSPDRSGAICDRYAQKDSRVRVIHKENGGVSAARNDGLMAAAGEYVIFCDGDDWMPSDACEKLWSAKGADVIFGDIRRVWENREEYMRLFEKPFFTCDRGLIREMVKTNFYYTYCPMPASQNAANGCYGGPWNKIIRRDFLIKNNIRFDSRLRGIYDDVIFTAYALAQAESVAYVGECVYCYRQMEQSMTRGFKADILQINDQIFLAWEAFLERFDPTDEWRQAYHANILRRLDHAMAVYFLPEAASESYRQRIRQLKRIMAAEPYRTAARNADRKKLNRRHRVLAVLAARHWALAAWLAYWMKNKLRYHHG